MKSLLKIYSYSKWGGALFPTGVGNTDFHRFLVNRGTHEIPIVIGNGKGNLTVAVFVANQTEPK